MTGALVNLLGLIPIVATPQMSAAVIQRENRPILKGLDQPCARLGNVFGKSGAQAFESLSIHLSLCTVGSPKEGKSSDSPGAGNGKESCENPYNPVEEGTSLMRSWISQ